MISSKWYNVSERINDVFSIVNPMSEDQNQSYVEGSLLPDLMTCRRQGSNQKPMAYRAYNR